MGLLRPSRERRGPDPYYHWKAILFSVGAGVGLGAMATGWDWLIWVAVPILAAGVALRWLPGGRGAPPDEQGDSPAEDEPADDGVDGVGGADPPEIPPPA